MEMKKYCIYILIIWLGISCEKIEDGDLSGSEKVIGRLFINDPLTNLTTDVPQAGKKLTIRYEDSPDPVNYLFSTTSDTNGYFEFANLKENRQYIIKYQETISGTIYEDSVSVTAPNNKVVLTGKVATSKQSGVLVEIRDFSGNLLKDATVCVFTSDSNIGYLNGTCDGSIFQLKTNSAGKASLFGLAAGTYYLFATKTFGEVELISRTKVDIAKSVVDLKIQVMKPRGISLVVTDPSGGLVREAKVCLFNSSTSLAYEQGTCEGSIYTGITDATGTVNFYGMPAGTYYAVTSLTVGEITLQGKQTILVSDKIEQSKITLTKPNGIHFVTTDANSEVLGNISVCVFTSSILYQKNSCEDANVQFTTDQSGKKNLYKLDKGTYYIYSSKIIGKDTLIAKNVVNVADQIVDCVLKLVKK